MRDEAPVPDPLVTQLKHFVVDGLGLPDVKADEITDDEPLMGGRIGLDPLDALELAICLEQEFGIALRSQNEFIAAFASIASLAGYIRDHAPAHPVARQTLLPFDSLARW